QSPRPARRRRARPRLESRPRRTRPRLRRPHQREPVTNPARPTYTDNLTSSGDVREHADVAELTGLVDASITTRWPAGMRLIVRRERPHPGAALSLFEHH